MKKRFMALNDNRSIFNEKKKGEVGAEKNEILKKTNCTFQKGI